MPRKKVVGEFPEPPPCLTIVRTQRGYVKWQICSDAVTLGNENVLSGGMLLECRASVLEDRGTAQKVKIKKTKSGKPNHR